jgi:cytochrome c-type biogenesis protein CcmH
VIDLKTRGAGLRRAALIGLALLLAATAADLVAVRAAAKTTLQAVSEGLTCQCGCGLTIANCAHPTCGFAIPLRGELQGLIDKGMSRDKILISMRQKYGEKILSAPTTEGFNILAWVMPFVAIVAGGALIVLAMGRWRGAPRESREGSEPQAEQFDPALRRRLEQELRNRL